MLRDWRVAIVQQEGRPTRWSETRSGGIGRGRVGGKGSVRRDVLEDLVDHGHHVGIVDGVEVAPAVAANGDHPGKAEFAQVNTPSTFTSLIPQATTPTTSPTRRRT